MTMGISLAVLFIVLAVLSIALLIESDAGEVMIGVVCWIAIGGSVVAIAKIAWWIGAHVSIN
jgi:hypothetical protein